MPDNCPECGTQVVSGCFCGCGVNQAAFEAILSKHGAEPIVLENLKTALETEGKTRVKEIERTKEQIKESLGRRPEVATATWQWLRAIHSKQFVNYEPKYPAKKTIGELGGEPRRRVSAGAILGKSIALILVGLVFVLCWPLALLAGGLVGLMYAKMPYAYFRWRSDNSRLSGEQRDALSDQARKLDFEIEALRVRHSEEQAQFGAIKERHKEVSEALKAMGRPWAASEVSQAAGRSRTVGVVRPGTMPATGGALLPGFEEMDEGTRDVERSSPEGPRGVLGLIKAAANIVPIRKCPKCRASFATKSDGEEILDTKSWLVGGRPDGDFFEKEPVAEKFLKVAKKSRCGRCGHDWREVSEVGKTVRGACPSCHEGETGKVIGEEILSTDYTVPGGGPDLDYFQGRTQVKLKVDYVESRRCKRCDFAWRQKAVRRLTLTGVCPCCYSDRKDPILREKVRSHDTHHTKKQSDVILNRNYDPVGQTIREESVVIREDWWEATFRCRSCSHEWKELSSETHRVF